MEDYCSQEVVQTTCLGSNMDCSRSAFAAINIRFRWVGGHQDEMTATEDLPPHESCRRAGGHGSKQCDGDDPAWFGVMHPAGPGSRKDENFSNFPPTKDPQATSFWICRPSKLCWSGSISAPLGLAQIPPFCVHWQAWQWPMIWDYCS